MNEEIEFILEEAKEQMDGSLVHLGKAFSAIRAGKASPSILSTVTVSAYGSQMPLNQVATVSATDSRTLVITPFDKSMLSDIEKGIFDANLGLTPQNNGNTVFISIPPLTEERRAQLAKQAKSETEDAKVSIRNVRRDANNDVKKLDVSEDLKSNAEVDIQELTDAYVKKADEMYTAKQQEIMTV